MLETIEVRARTFGGRDHQRLQNSHILRSQSRCDLVVYPGMNPSPQAVCQSLKGAEGWQINRGLAQFFNSPIDEVRRVAHGLCDLKNGAGDQALARIGVSRDAEIGPNRCSVAMKRRLPPLLFEKGRRNCHLDLQGKIGHGVGVNITQRWKASKILAGFQYHRQCQAAHVASGICANEGKVRVGQIIPGAQFLARRFAVRK